MWPHPARRMAPRSGPFGAGRAPQPDWTCRAALPPGAPDGDDSVSGHTGGTVMKVLVTYATRHGATRGIAERIAAALERHDLDVTLEPAAKVADAAAFDAAVIGSAAYAFHWLGDA